MEKNPFSIYDFMGYLFPGILTLFFIQFLWDGNKDSLYNLLNIKNIENVINGSGDSFNLQMSVICIVMSYVTGHIIAYLSSITVEYFSNKTFGYPSEYLMEVNEHEWLKLLERYFLIRKENFHLGRLLWRTLISIILFPVSFISFTLGHFSGINEFITRPLDSYVISSIKTKSFEMATKLGINKPSINSKCDYHRIIMHYVYFNISNCQGKTDNYISLYGFLRAICFIFNSMFLFVCFKAIPTIDFDASFDEKIVWTLFILFALSYITYLGFMKFYRRFTLENYMALLTEKK